MPLINLMVRNPLIHKAKKALLNKLSFLWTLLFSLFLIYASLPPAYADMNMVAKGAGRTLYSAFSIPREMIGNAGTAFPLGIVAGALDGGMKTVAGTVIGASEMARGAAPYAKYMLFFI